MRPNDPPTTLEQMQIAGRPDTGEPMYPCIEPHADAPLCGHGELPPERVIAWNLAIIAGNLDRIATVLEREAMNRAGL